MTERFDVEMFISEVKKYPEIWDLNCEDYRLKKRKDRAWAEVARVFIADFDDMTATEKNEIYRSLYGKWRNLRDSFVRHLRKDGDSKNSYVYANNLAFLNDLYKPGSTQSDEELMNCPEDQKPKRKKIKYNKFEDIWNRDEISPVEDTKIKGKDIEFIDTFPTANCSTSFQMEDEDRSFFDSLLPAVRELTIDQKLEFRSEVISALKNIRSTNKFKLDPGTGDFSETM
ncbi:uncharacterized protein LOC135081956 [Ostrinia nubilalis]|uniref:uncharacterized protein LOC114359817 n=1 Tax=Ostrinia furnacalis TaxID=93504 RepID=UPI00103898FA|nr:uncharacterized protein LOC114359817 [Ostrinia furnacalis]